jgi:hypothetical protein
MFQKKNIIKSDNKKNKFLFIKKFILVFFVFYSVFLITININNIKLVYAQIYVTDQPLTAGQEKQTAQDKILKALEKAYKKSGAIALRKAIYNALQTLAYDTATWIGSGGRGQKPLFIREGWEEYLTNIADSAAGEFIESLNKEWGVNLCEPSAGVKTKIGLGLMQYSRPKKPDCTFSEMKKNWDRELQRPDFLSRFQSMFNPTQSDLGIALSLHTRLSQEITNKAKFKGLERIANKGWLDLRNIAGRSESPPNYADRKLGILMSGEFNALSTFTGDALIDAANVFLNQLAITLFNNLIASIGRGKDTYTSPYGGDYGGLGSYESGPIRGGIKTAKDKFRQLKELNFSVRGDYDILAELSQCPNPTKAGPTNCVITENFRQAITNNMTVGEAIKQGYLNPNGIFGFTADGLEPPYNEGYPYRSMIILRKFRIIPATWELTAQYIKENKNKLDGTKNLGDLVACFSKDDEYEGYYSAWCDGAVDPSWLLKAPMNFCKREGFGPEIFSEQIAGTGDDSKLIISRNDNYCADEQSCIKENDDGSCQLYGYCMEEKRNWNFNGSSCDPKYNTCQTFRARDGKTISYLENSLDYNGCSADNVGCQWYCMDYNNAATPAPQWSCTNLTGNKIYLDSDAEECVAEDEGCHEFIRVKAGMGTNLLKNSSFEEFMGVIDDGSKDNFDYWGNIGEAVSDSFYGQTALKLSAPLSVSFIVGPNNFSVDENTYTLSFFAKDCGTTGEFGIETSTSTLDTTSQWKQFSITYTYPEFFGGNSVGINIAGFSGTCVIDAIKLERGAATPYSEYRDADTLVYEKLLPKYLENVCYENPGTDFNLKKGAPPVCNNFARKCNKDDEGCNIYTSTTDGISIPAKVTDKNYCPAECVGYDVFVQKETTFDSLRDSYFIPSTAESCGAQNVGCDEFTNLDTVSKGGEGLEYYTYLRQCVKPSPSDCAEFYTWEGSDETGYQLRVFQLKKDPTAAVTVPYVSDPAATYNGHNCQSASDYDPKNNPMCREFYNTNGDIIYRFYHHTLTCSDNCLPYRRTENNIDPAITNQASCSPGRVCADSFYDGKLDDPAKGQCWDNSANVCYVCKNGGAWSSQHFACIYNAIPGEGQSCAADQSGCREYTGNRGNNTRVILSNDFEGSTQGWESAKPSTTVTLSNESLVAGGNSLFVSSPTWTVFASTTVGRKVTQGKSYVLSFIAKAELQPSQLFALFLDPTTSPGKLSKFNGQADLVNNEWRFFELNLPELDHQVVNEESLVIYASRGFYIDDIKLTEISDNYYLRKNTWNTPDACFEDIQGNPVGNLYNLGCDEYYDQSNTKYYLHSFDKLCQDSAVGCELMIDTHNYTKASAGIWNDDDLSGTCDSTEPDCVYVPADEFMFVVYDKDKECGSSSKGCQFLGKPYSYDSEYLFSDVYLKNDPDAYSSPDGSNNILCAKNEAGCEEWTTEDSISYFKDPGDQVCEWRQVYGTKSGNWGWYKKKVNRCDTDGDGFGDGKLCFTDQDCATPYQCLEEGADNPCPVNTIKTFGFGGIGQEVEQPRLDSGIYWAGLCPVNQSGCTEYIDPVSRFSSNLLFNSNFNMDIVQDVDLDLIADGWGAKASGTQDILLEPNTLYVLSIEGQNVAEIIPPVPATFYELDTSNNLLPATSVITQSYANSRVSKMFYNTNNNLTVRVTVENTAAPNDSKVELKKAIVDYQLKQDINKEDCNGVVNFEDGCVLFNERAQDGLNLAGLNYDADYNIVNPAYNTPYDPNPNDGSEDSNALIKVSPDRDCNKWLACRSMVAVKNDNGEVENVCFDVGACDRVDDNGNCDNFVVENKEEQTATPGGFSKFSNTVGYSKVGLYGVGDDTMKGNYPLGEMEQKGEVANVPNGNFETAGTNKYPIGWIWTGGSWNDSVFKVIDNPVAAQNEGIGYAPEGRNFLKLGSIYSATSEFVDVISDITYTITAYVNTINLSNGMAKIKIEQYDSSANPILSAAKDVIWHDRGKDWDFQVGTFLTDSNAAKIKVTLYASQGAIGNFYFDDIRIRPALNTRKSDITMTSISGNEWYTAQSCRLYPEGDSLSCEYFDESGIKKDGWWGYCLEHDRYPGSTDACLLWWPVDKVKGDGIEEGAGYNDRFPLYYCVDASNGLEAGITCSNRSNCYDLESTHYCVCDPVYSESDARILLGNGPEIHWSIWGRGGCAVQEMYVKVEPTDNWIQIWSNNTTGSFDIDVPEATIGAKYFKSIRVYVEGDCDGPSLSVYNKYTKPECLKIAQTVTPAGQNKFWSGRVYNGSDYNIICNTNIPLPQTNICDYTVDYAPFGSIFPPYPENNPYEWDSKSDPGVQPLYYEDPNYDDPNYDDPNGQPRMGQLYSKSDLQRLFAKSYGIWAWSSKECVGGVKDGFSCYDDTDCAGTCETYCAAGTTPPIYGGACTTASDCVSYVDNFGGAVCAPSSGTCDSGCNIGKPCSTNEDCRSGYCDSSTLLCVNGFNDGASCDDGTGNPDDSICMIPNCFTCDSNYMLCAEDNTINCSNNPGACSGTCGGMGSGRYVPVYGQDWEPPNTVCPPGAPRPDYPNDYCAIPPKVRNIKINYDVGEIGLRRNGFVNLTFNSEVDDQQLPMVMYAVDWGDNETTVVTGVEMRDKPNLDDPHSLYHLYNYWDLKAKQAVNQTFNNSQNSVYCGNAYSTTATNNTGASIVISKAPACDYCVVQPKVQIKDNWGWCNNGTSLYDCNNWEYFTGKIIVTEKCDYALVSLPSCGDKNLDAGEDCDDGANGNVFDQCDDNCAFTYCGDGFTQKPNGVGTGGPADDGYEECDGGSNCSANCTFISPLVLVQPFNSAGTIIPDCSTCQVRGGTCIDDDTVPGYDSCSWDISSYVYASSTVDAVGFYNYNSLKERSDMTEPTIPKSDRSELFMFMDQTTGTMSLGILHDTANDNTGGAARFDFANISGNMTISAVDDPTTAATDPDTYDIGYNLSSGDAWLWSWSATSTDGGMIDLPTSGNWSITITPTFTSGINKWVFSIGSNTAWIELDTAVPATIRNQ